MRTTIEFLRDLRYGGRLLRRSAAFSTVAILSLGLGIGGATAVFTLVNAIVLRTLPVPNPQQLFVARVTDVPQRSGGDRFSAPLYARARIELASTGTELAAATGITGMQLLPEGESVPARGNAQLVSGEYFSLLRQRSQLGRLLEPADNDAGARPAAVISDSYWRRRFGGSAGAIGRTLTINGVGFTVVGVAPARFFGTTVALRAPDVWIPFVMQPAVRYDSNVSAHGDANSRDPWPPQRTIEWLNLFVRAPTRAAASAAASAITVLLHRDHEAALSKSATADERARVRRQRVELEDASAGVSSLRAGLSQPLFVLLAMVGVLLVIACGNVAGLLLSRAAAREREMAIRLSIGAARGRLVRQLLAESLLLAAAGGLAGVILAVWARDALLALLVNAGASAAPIDLNTGIDWRVLAFAGVVSAVTGFGCGVLPAFGVTRVSVSESLKQQSRSAGAEGGRRGLVVGKALVTAQMAFCLLLLVVAGLFARSLQSLTRIDVGFDRDHLLAARVDVRSAGYTPDERQALYRRVVDRLRAVPGVQAASMSLNGPLDNSAWTSSMTVEGYTAARGERLLTNEEIVTDEYFDAVGLRIVQGRGFGPEDRAKGSRNTIVNATMAKRFFPGQSAIGKRWTYGDAIDSDAFVIVGVVEDARYVSLRDAPPNMAYHLADTLPDEALGDIEIRTAGSPAAAARTIRATLEQTEPRLPVIEVVPLTQRIDRDTNEDRMVARLTLVFGTLALLLASLGLYGTISYGISRRIAELGLRMALGANRRTVLVMILREALTLVAIGTAVGLPLAYVAARALSVLLYRTGPADPLSFAAGALTLVVVAALAAYLPAYRASRIEPMVALSR
jgi:predicted permease